MINATLCTTNNKEPWAANVNFEVNNIDWSTTLKTKYAHYSNLQTNKSAVIVYKDGDLELIIKALADVSDSLQQEEDVNVSFKVNWLRLVKDGNISDLKEETDILTALNSLNL
jgi:hypothetical protein